MRDVTPTPTREGSPRAFLRALIRAEGGSISVERFMQEALYHSGFGYYARKVRAVGRTGDFSTSATLHPALGQAIAAWALAHRAEVAHGRTWHLIELGGGSGELAAEVLRAVSWWAGRRLRYHLVEISEGLQAAQRQRLQGNGAVQWHGGPGSALLAADGAALIFSNEFVDAFPCVQLARGTTAGEWREVRIVWPDGEDVPGEVLADWRGPLPASDRADGWPAGQRVEMHLAYRRWLADAVQGWQRGRILTVDYGAETAATLYRRRPRGTLRAYCRHQRVEGTEIYQRFTQQDLTADVNFGDLRRWGDDLGLRAEGLSTQAEFLQRWLPARMMKKAATEPALSFLLDPDGAGGAFKVLEQTR